MFLNINKNQQIEHKLNKTVVTGFNLFWSMLNCLKVTSWKTLIFRWCTAICNLQWDCSHFLHFDFLVPWCRLLSPHALYFGFALRKGLRNRKSQYILHEISQSFRYDMFFFWMCNATYLMPPPQTTDTSGYFPDILTTFHRISGYGNSNVYICMLKLVYSWSKLRHHRSSANKITPSKI